jgi:FkbM family methyltransferase
MYTPYNYPSSAAALQPPLICRDDVGSEPWTFKWYFEQQPARFWIQRRSFLFHQIKDRKHPYQHANTETLRRLTNSKKLRRIIDVGLNIGMMSSHYSRFAEQVSAFEPDPKMIELATKNLVLNNADHNVKCYELALADKPGVMNFSDITDNGAISRLASDTAHLKTNRKLSTCFKVQVATIDQFAFDDVDAIKIDTEGSELLVMQGAMETIKRCLPLVQAELMLTTIKNWKWPNGVSHDPQDSFDMLAPLGYKMFYGGKKLSIATYPTFAGETRQQWVYKKGLSDVFFVHESKLNTTIKDQLKLFAI